MIKNILILAATAGMAFGVPDLGWHIIFLDIEWVGSLTCIMSFKFYILIFCFSPDIFSNAGHTLSKS